MPRGGLAIVAHAGEEDARGWAALAHFSSITRHFVKKGKQIKQSKPGQVLKKSPLIVLLASVISSRHNAITMKYNTENQEVVNNRSYR